MPDNLCKSLFSLFCVFIMSMLMGSAEAGRNEAFKNYKRLFLTCIAKKLCSENLFSSSILHLKRCRRHDFCPTRHLWYDFYKAVKVFSRRRNGHFLWKEGNRVACVTTVSGYCGCPVSVQLQPNLAHFRPLLATFGQGEKVSILEMFRKRLFVRTVQTKKKGEKVSILEKFRERFKKKKIMEISIKALTPPTANGKKRKEK